MKLSLLLIAVGFLLVPAASAQDTMLTKEETINYLRKKLQEVSGRNGPAIWTGSKETAQFSQLSLNAEGDYLVLKYAQTTSSRCESKQTMSTWSFNPAHMTNIVLVPGSENDSVRILKVQFAAKTAKFYQSMKSKNSCDRTDGSGSFPGYYEKKEIYFPLYATAPGNRSNVERALLHLRDLAKAEDDPFGN